MPNSPSAAPRPLRLAVPLLSLVPGAMGGSETYVQELVSRLAAARDVAVRFAVPPAAASLAPETHRLVVPGTGRGSTAKDRLLSQLRAEASGAARRLVASADVVHYPLTVPSPRPGRRTASVQTLHDTQHLTMPENFSVAERTYRTVRYDRPARSVDAVITVSQFCKSEIVEHLGVPDDRVHVAHLGVDTTEFAAHRGAREEFVLYPARGWPHKNHAGLVAAMRLVREQRPELRLVLTGGGLEALGPMPDWVERRGHISRPELLDLYRRAACLAFPSLYEGFGLPPLEAMASGCPVAAADIASIPEVCGDAAELFDPRDPSAIAAGILATLRRTSELADRGLERVKDFTWERCITAHLDVYRRVAGH